MWSPKVSKGGRLDPFYEFMREVAPRDLVFSFADTLIKSIGIATSSCYDWDAPRRAERYGLGFLIRVSAPEEPFSIQINIRIKPQRTEGSRQESHPYVVNYVVDQTASTELLLSFDHIAQAANYASYVGLIVEDWYLRRFALVLDQGDGKLFLKEVRTAGKGSTASNLESTSVG